MRIAPIALVCLGFALGLAVIQVTRLKDHAEHLAGPRTNRNAEPEGVERDKPPAVNEPPTAEDDWEPDVALFGPADGALSAALAAERDETDEAFRYLFRHNGTSDEAEQMRHGLFNEICQDPARKKRMPERIITELKADRGHIVKEIMTIPKGLLLFGDDSGGNGLLLQCPMGWRIRTA